MTFYKPTHSPGGRGLLQRATMEKEVVESPPTEIRMEVSAKADPDRVSEGGLVRGHTSRGG